MTTHPRLAALAIAIASAIASPASAQSDDESWLGPDKAMHFGLSAGIAAGSYGVGALLFENYAPRLLFGAGVTLSLGAAKELVDLTGAGDASWKDFAWDVIGMATGLLIAFLLDLAVHLTRARPPDEARAPRLQIAF